MEIKKIEDKKTWDKALKRFEYTTMFLSWEWGEFERSIGSNFENWGVFNGGSVVGLIPIKIIKAKRGKYIHLRHAPLIDWDNKDVVGEVRKFILQRILDTGSHFARISPLIPKSEESVKMLKDLGFKPSLTHATDAELTVVLDLKQTEEEILKNMRKTTRNLIKKAQKMNISVRHTDDFSLFDDFTKIYLDTVKRQKWNAYSVEFIKKEYGIFSREKSTNMFVSYLDSEPISASIFIKHRDQIIYHYSGSLTKYRNVPSAYLLHWEAIKYYKSLGFSLYNFWGVCPEHQRNHPWYGLSLFKRGFTKDELEFVHAHDLIVKPLAYPARIYDYLEAKIRGYR